MKINKIKKENNGQYTILFEDGSKVKTYDDVILKHNLLYDKKLDNQQLNEIEEENKYYDTYNKIVKMISKRLRSEYEIKVYMNEENTPLPYRLQILESLKDRGLIDDLAYAKAYTNDKFYINHYGPNKIKQELEKNCINYEYIKLALLSISEEDIKEYINKFISKKITSNRKDSSYVLKNKIISTLQNNGYYKEDIVEELNKYSFESDEIIKKEYDRIKKSLSKKYEEDGLEREIINKLYKRGFSHEEINTYLDTK